jgi:hypothetical protein
MLWQISWQLAQPTSDAETHVRLLTFEGKSTATCQHMMQRMKQQHIIVQIYIKRASMWN